MPPPMEDPVVAVLLFATFLVSAVAHEAAHALVADRLGDPTPRAAGRISWNPTVHLDPWVSVILPLAIWYPTKVFLGGARVAPTDPTRLSRRPRDEVLVALAGPATNLALALAGVPAGWLARGAGARLELVAFGTVVTNLVLVIFQLVPLPPLKGARLVRAFLSPERRRRYESIEPYGMFLLVAVFAIPPITGLIRGAATQGAHLMIYGTAAPPRGVGE